MKYEERFVLTTFEAAAIAFMALDGKQIKRCGFSTGVVLFFLWLSEPIEVQIPRFMDPCYHITQSFWKLLTAVQNHLAHTLEKIHCAL